MCKISSQEYSPNPLVSSPHKNKIGAPRHFGALISFFFSKAPRMSSRHENLHAPRALEHHWCQIFFVAIFFKFIVHLGANVLGLRGQLPICKLPLNYGNNICLLCHSTLGCRENTCRGWLEAGKGAAPCSLALSSNSSCAFIL